MPQPAIIFTQRGDFAASTAAVDALKAAGFSIGPTQAGHPRAVLHGDWTIAKWRNLSAMERRMADGEIHGSRVGPVKVLISAGAPDHVLEAFGRVRQIALAQADRVAA